MGEISSKRFSPLCEAINLALNLVLFTRYALRQVLAFLEWKSNEREAWQLDHNPKIFFLFH